MEVPAMNVKSIVVVVAAALVCGLASVASAQSGSSLGSVRIPHAVTANGQTLPAGTYTVRLSSDTVTPVVGQAPDSEQWVEFVQAGQVKGRELASVVKPEDVKAVAKMTPPAPGKAKVQTLKGADYLRIWLNHAGTQYLVHLDAAPAAAAAVPASAR
jgi:hypothetical protein